MRSVVNARHEPGTIRARAGFRTWWACWWGRGVTHQESESGGIEKALLTCGTQPVGEFLMMVAASACGIRCVRGCARPLAEG